MDGGGAHFGREVVKVPARRVPEAVFRLLALYQEERRAGEDPTAFFRRADRARVRTLLADLTELDPGTVEDADLVDLGTSGPFTLMVSAGECAS